MERMMDSSTVEYRDIPGFLGYRVGSDGSVWSCLRQGNTSGLTNVWRLRKQHRSKGYFCVRLRLGRGYATRTTHRLILHAFVGPSPEGMECSHENGDSTDNRIENLKWKTHLENIRDKERHGTTGRGPTWKPRFRTQPARLRFSVAKVLEVRAKILSGATQTDLAKAYGVARSTIFRIAKRKSWTEI